jgi:hypothetical protein
VNTYAGQLAIAVVEIGVYAFGQSWPIQAASYHPLVDYDLLAFLGGGSSNATLLNPVTDAETDNFIPADQRVSLDELVARSHLDSAYDSIANQQTQDWVPPPWYSGEVVKEGDPDTQIPAKKVIGKYYYNYPDRRMPAKKVVGKYYCNYLDAQIWAKKVIGEEDCCEY